MAKVSSWPTDSIAIGGGAREATHRRRPLLRLSNVVGRHQYDTYFGDPHDGLGGSHDPFYSGADTAVPGSPRGVRIAALPMPADLIGNSAVGSAHWYSGVLDTPVHLRYGFFVARVRLPQPRPGMSPAWWLLTNNATPQGSHGPRNGEWDVQEMFGNDLGTGMNAGTILWNSGASKPQNWGGTFDWPHWERGTPRGYHDYGALSRPAAHRSRSTSTGPAAPATSTDAPPGSRTISTAFPSRPHGRSRRHLGRALEGTHADVPGRRAGRLARLAGGERFPRVLLDRVGTCVQADDDRLLTPVSAARRPGRAETIALVLIRS